MQRYLHYILDKLKIRRPVRPTDNVTLATVALIIVVWIIDLFVPDPIPFIDEILLPFIAYIITYYYNKKKSK
jgi:hypothetical protein